MIRSILYNFVLNGMFYAHSCTIMDVCINIGPYYNLLSVCKYLINYVHYTLGLCNISNLYTYMCIYEIYVYKAFNANVIHTFAVSWLSPSI